VTDDVVVGYNHDITRAYNVGIGFKKKILNSFDLVFHSRYGRYGKFQLSLGNASNSNKQFGVNGDYKISMRSIEHLIKIQYNF